MIAMNQFEQGINRYIAASILDKFSRIKIGIAGAGGLGSNCAQMLVRTGFKLFKIIDFDKVEASNLNRQFFFLHQIGMPKVEALKSNLTLINPDVQIEVTQRKYSTQDTFFEDCDVIVEAFDRPECKKLIVENYLNSPKLLIAASGLAGWGNSDNITIHRIRDNFFVVGDLTSAVSAKCPPLAPRVQVAAAKQADIIVSHFLDNR
ncbi:hypothetical protein SRRS_27320 [Sporomusa rhizae]